MSMKSRTAMQVPAPDGYPRSSPLRPQCASVQMSPVRSPPQVQSFRSTMQASPNQRSRPRSPDLDNGPRQSRESSLRPQSLEKNAFDPSQPSYVRGNSQSRQELRPNGDIQIRTMSPDPSVQTLAPPSIVDPRRCAPPTSPARVISSRRTMPARMAGIPAAWLPPTAASTSASAAPVPPRSGFPATSGSVQLAPGGSQSGQAARSQPMATAAQQQPQQPHSPTAQVRSGSSAGPPQVHPSHRYSAASPPGRGSLDRSGVPGRPVVPATASGAAPPSSSPETALRGQPVWPAQPWQVMSSAAHSAGLSAAAPPTVPPSAAPVGERRTLGSSWAAMSGVQPMTTSVLQVHSLARQTNF